jgi:hypothetical protein
MYRDFFVGLKKQLSTPSGSLLQAQKDFLRQVAEHYIVGGLTLEQSFNRAELVNKPRGKCSDLYQKAKLSRNRALKTAFDALDGEPWNKCVQLAGIAARAQRLHRMGRFEPKTNIEQLVLKLLRDGHTVPATANGIKKSLSFEQLNPK